MTCIVTFVENKYCLKKDEYVCKKDDRPSHQKSRSSTASKGGLSKCLTLQKRLKMFITKYMLVVRFITSKT